MIGSNLDIANRDKWDESQYLSFYKQRFWDMEAGRKSAEATWDVVDESMNLISYYNNIGELEVIIPLDKVLIEIYEGRTKGIINYNVKNDWQANSRELQPAKYVLKHILDWADNNNFWEDNKAMKSLKAKYGNWFFFTGIRSYKEYVYSQKEDAVIEWAEDLKKSNFEENVKETWDFYPKNIHPKDFYIDDNALGQNKVQYAEDCIMKEKITLTELHLRYKKNKSINQKNLDNVTYSVDPSPKNDKDTANSPEDIIIYHYYHRVTKTYIIVANNEQMLYNWLYFYKDGKLPFENIQHYYTPDSFYALGISWRVSYLKSFKSDIFQNILTTSSMAAWINLIVSNDDEVWQDWEVWGRQVNLWRTSGWAENVKPVSTTPNLWVFTQILDLVDRETAIVTWINPSEQIDAWSDILWIVEINEANKAVRSWSVDEAYEIGLDNTLTMCMSRIQQFVPSLLWKKLTSGKSSKMKYATIKLKDVKVTKRGWKTLIEEYAWEYGELELSPDNLVWGWVKITTSSTSSVLPIIERRRVTDYVNIMLTLAQAAQLDVSWKAMQQLVQQMNFEQLVEWAKDAYEFDQDTLKVNTNRDNIRDKNIKKLAELQKALSIDLNTNVPKNQEVPNPMEWEQKPEAIAWPAELGAWQPWAVEQPLI